MQTIEEFDPYVVLGLPPGASAREAKAQFRRLAKRFHPDLNPGSEWHQEQFRRVHAAYELIDRSHRRGASAPKPGEAPPAASVSEVSGMSDAAWVHVGKAAYYQESPFVSEAVASHQRHTSGRRFGRAQRAGLVTGGLALVAFLLIVFAMAGPHGHRSAVADGIAFDSSSSLATPDLLPPADLPAAFGTSATSDMDQPMNGTTNALNSGVVPAPRSEAYEAPFPAVSTQDAASNSGFPSDTSYTQIAPTDTAVDPQSHSVDVQEPIDSKMVGIDPKSTGIDPQLIRP